LEEKVLALVSLGKADDESERTGLKTTRLMYSGKKSTLNTSFEKMAETNLSDDTNNLKTLITTIDFQKTNKKYMNHNRQR
jgi:hypothetical protein